LRDSKIDRAHTRLIARLDCIQSAGTALRWVREGTPLREPEHELYLKLSQLIERLDETNVDPKPATQLAEFGMSLLSSLGWGLELSNCVRCDTACPPGKAATLSPLRGGLVCQKCGGGLMHVPGPLRARLIDSSAGKLALLDEDAAVTLELVEQSLRSHVGEATMGKR
jgi:DNA repair protein RecO (recombination protein O)